MASPAGLAERRPLPHRRPSGPSVGRAAALELDASGVSDLGSSGVTTHVNKVHHVTTITQVARDLEEDEDWLWDIANEMEIEDGVIWVYGVGEDGILAFTDFGIESLIELITMTRTIQRCSSVRIDPNDLHAAFALCFRSVTRHFLRSGHTGLVVSGAAVSGGGADYTISYRVNDGKPARLPTS